MVSTPYPVISTENTQIYQVEVVILIWYQLPLNQYTRKCEATRGDWINNQILGLKGLKVFVHFSNAWELVPINCWIGGNNVCVSSFSYGMGFFFNGCFFFCFSLILSKHISTRSMGHFPLLTWIKLTCTNSQDYRQSLILRLSWNQEIVFLSLQGNLTLLISGLSANLSLFIYKISQLDAARLGFGQNMITTI